MLDVTGPWAVFGHANDCLGFRAYELLLVSPSGGPVLTRHGLTLAGALSLGACQARGRAHTIIVSGGDPRPERPVEETQVASYLRQHHRRVRRIASVCTGAFVLADAGLLDRRRATTHWRARDELAARFPKARVVEDSIFVHDGKIWTSAGVTAGIDLALALLEHDHGREVASRVARHLVLFLRRSGHQAQFSDALRLQSSSASPLDGLLAFVMGHLSEPLPVARLARHLAMSPRSLTRQCQAQWGEAPAALVKRLRLNEARRLLEETALPLKAVASDTGFGDPSTLWRVFERELGVTPGLYRERFKLSI